MLGKNDKVSKKSIKKKDKKENFSASSNPIDNSTDIKKKYFPDDTYLKNNPYFKELEEVLKPDKTFKNKNNPYVQNPEFNSIIHTINSFSKSKASAKRHLPQNAYTNAKHINYALMMKAIAEAFQNNTSLMNLFSKLSDIFVNKSDWEFIGFGLVHEKSKCLNIRLYSKAGNAYNSKIFLSDETNSIVKCYNTKTIIEENNIDYIKNSYLNQTGSVLIPMISANKCMGVMIAGKYSSKLNMDFTAFMANYLGMYIHNILLLEQTNRYANTDTLTSLYTHRGFQEVLAKELQKSKDNNTPLSVIIFDVNNISKINRELGHAKGDEVIKIIADKVKQNIKNTDSAGRYGGDEIAVIMPETDTHSAKYMAEYITYSLSCCFVDDVGPVKVSVGIATYPDSAQDQEKLLLLAEQAMYISQAKGYKEGMSAIISTEDFNFWDDVAVNSFAQILSKRHFQSGINFEDELVKRINNVEIINHNNLMEMVTSLAGAIDAKDPYTKGHSTSVSRYSEALARALNLPEDEVEHIKIGALLHDIGKIGIPENVLKKPGKLDDEEYTIMKQHPTIGAEKVLAPNEALREFIPIVKHHHERLDGKGYPDRLKGEEIPLEARIVSVADAYHALVSDRPYRKGMPIEKACSILQEGAGTQWDSDLVRIFISIAPSLTTSV